MKREHIGNGLYVEISTTGAIVLTEGETDDLDNFFANKAIIMEIEQYGALVDYMLRAMVYALPPRSRR